MKELTNEQQLFKKNTKQSAQDQDVEDAKPKTKEESMVKSITHPLFHEAESENKTPEESFVDATNMPTKTTITDIVPIRTDGRGFENSTAEDIIIPRLKLMQALSPELETMPDLKPGDFLNSLTLEKFDKPLKIVPVFFLKTRIKFKPREEGGIDCRSYDAIRPSVGKMYQPFCSDCEFSKWDNQTGKNPACDAVLNFICFLPDYPEIPFISLSFARTGYKTGMKLLSIAKFRGGDIFSYYYHVDSKQVSNDKGRFYVLNITPGVKTSPQDHEAGAKFYEIVSQMKFDIHQEPLEVVDSEEKTIKEHEQDNSGSEPQQF